MQLSKTKKRQVITVTPEGSLIGLNHKKQGLDLRKVGAADIKRVTEIVFRESDQKWCVQFLQGSRRGGFMSYNDKWRYKQFIANPEFPPFDLGERRENGFILLFTDYEDAVKAEVLTLQASQLDGTAYLYMD